MQKINDIWGGKSLNLSIIVPMYNVENYIRRCLDSIINQGLQENEFEIIIIDDGSTDTSYEIALSYCADYDNIRVYQQGNSGVSVARNRGLDLAKGRYIYYVDGDDALLPHSLKSVYKYIQGPISFDNVCEAQMPQIVCFGAVEGRDDVMNLSYLSHTDDGERIEIGSGCDYLAKHDYIQAVWWYFVEKKLIDDLGLRFEEGVISEDVPFTATLFLEAKYVISTDKKVYFYSYNINSETRSLSVSKQINVKNGLVYANVALNSILKRYNSMPSDCQQRLIRKRDNGLRTALAISMQYCGVRETYKLVRKLKREGLHPLEWTVPSYTRTDRLIWQIVNNSLLILMTSAIYQGKIFFKGTKFL